MIQRIPFIDSLRATCIIYIVGFWHLFNYTEVFPGYYNEFSLRITVIILGLFVFLSGYLLALKNISLDIHSLKDFFWNRIFRIYPLYILALGIFLVSHITDRSSALKAALILSMFYGPPPPTLWFITMLLVFYLVAPILNSTLKHGSRFVVVAATVFSVFLFLVLILPAGDFRIAVYFPAFALGIYSGKNHQLLKAKQYIIALGFLFGLAFSLFVENKPEHSLISIGIATLGPTIVFLISHRYKDNFPKNKLVILVSFSGFVMYLIHRPVFQLMKGFYFPNSSAMQIAYLYFFCLPIIIFLSWVIQKNYDKFVQSIRAQGEV